VERDSLRGTRQPGSALRGLFPFALLVSFAVIALLIVLLGVQVYGAIDARGTETHRSRTTLLYLAGKVRAADPGCVDVVQRDGVPVLRVRETAQGEVWYTYIYHRDGALCEYFGSAARAFDADFGAPVTQTPSFDVQLADGMLTVTSDGHTLHLTLPEGGSDA